MTTNIMLDSVPHQCGQDFFAQSLPIWLTIAYVLDYDYWTRIYALLTRIHSEGNNTIIIKFAIACIITLNIFSLYPYRDKFIYNIGLISPSIVRLYAHVFVSGR